MVIEAYFRWIIPCDMFSSWISVSTVSVLVLLLSTWFTNLDMGIPSH